LIQQIFQVLVCSSVEEGMISTVLHDCTEGLDEEIGCKNPALFFMPGLPRSVKRDLQNEAQEPAYCQTILQAYF